MNFYIDVGNNGPDVSEDTKLTFSDNISDLTFESVSFSKGGMDEVLPVWNIGTLEVGEEAMIDFEGILNETGEDITLTATISGSNFDPNSEDNVLVKIIETHDASPDEPDTMLIEVDQGGVAIQTEGVTIEWREEGGEWSGESNILTSGEGTHQIEIRITEILDDYYDYRYVHFAPVNWVNGRLVRVIRWFETNLVSCKFRFSEDFYMPPVAPRSERWDEMFSECEGFTGSSGLSSWETSHVSNMRNMFYSCRNLNADLSSWDVSGVQDMSWMFYRCNVFNSDLSAWDTRSVKLFARMFEQCSEFNSDLSLWNTSECTNMYLMFAHAGKYNQPMGDWDTSNVTDMYGMFERCTVFNQDISSWDVRKVSRERMASMFRWASSFNQDLSSWCVSHIAQEPLVFKTNANSWTLPDPVWGTCPQRFIRLDYRDAVEGSVGSFSAFGKYNGDLISGQPPAFLGKPVYRNGFYYHPVVYTNGSQSFTIMRISQEPEIDFNGSSGQSVLDNLDSAGLDRIEVTYAGVVSDYVVPRSSYTPSGNFLEIQAGPWPSQVVYNNCKNNPVGNYIKLFWN